MKKLLVLIIFSAFILVNITACSNKKNSTANMIQAKRRFAEYVEPQTQKGSGTIDLSEGPKLNYEAKFGPKNLNFDIKIVDPY